jgi:hypothetical protein
VDEASLDVSWAAGVTPGGAAADLDCVGCVTLGALAEGILTAANVAYDDSATKLSATTVAGAVAKLDSRVDTLENTGPGNINEGNGTVVPFVESWTMQALGKARQNFHIFNPTANPKVLLYLNSGEPEDSPDLLDKTISGNYPAGVFAQLTSSAFAGTTSISVNDGALFKKGDLVLLYQVVTATGSPAGIWEIVQVRSVVGNTIVPVVALSKTFTHCGNDCGIAQAVRIERFKSLTVASGGVIYPSDDLSGDETRGGIVAVIADTITVKAGGRIHANSHGFEPGNGGVSYDGERGHSECNISEDSRSKSPNCSGGGGAYSECCWYSRAGAGGGGNKTAGANGTGNSWQGQGGQAKGDGTTARLHFGGGGGYGWPSSGGVGGGIVVLAAKNLTIESGGVVESNGANGGGNTNSGDYAGAGGGAGGTVAIFSSNYSSVGTVQATGGTGGDGYSNYDGGRGGDGWVLTSNALDSFLVRSIPSKVKILLDGEDVTAALGDPNDKGAPHWNNGAWGNGIDQWSTGELDLTSQGTWTLGQHSLVLKEEGGSGGVLEMAMYLIYPFTASTVPENDTCAKPKVIDVMGGSATLSDTTEDTMGRIKATDDFVQAGCGGSGGPDTVYKLELTDWRKLTIDVTAAFTPRVYVRKGDCAAGSMMACGGAQTVTPDLKTGTYYLFVDGDGNLQKGNFKLDVTAAPPAAAANDTCAGATTLTLDENGKAEIYGVTFFSNDDYLGGCGGSGAKDLVYRIDVPNGFETMKATVDSLDFAPAIYMSNTTCGPNWITCSPTKVAVLSWPAAGTYYIVVDGKTANDKGEFTLKVEMIAPL